MLPLFTICECENSATSLLFSNCYQIFLGYEVKGASKVRVLVQVWRLINQISFSNLLVLVSLCDFRMTMTFIVSNHALRRGEEWREIILRVWQGGRFKTVRKRDHFKVSKEQDLFELFSIGNWRVELNYMSRLHLIQQIKMKVWFYNFNKLRLEWHL